MRHLLKKYIFVAKVRSSNDLNVVFLSFAISKLENFIDHRTCREYRGDMQLDRLPSIWNIASDHLLKDTILAPLGYTGDAMFTVV